MEARGRHGSRHVAGVILAAGVSRRLGRSKQLLDLGGEPLLRHTIRNAVTSSLDDVVVVLGSRAGEIGAAVGDLGQLTVVNDDYAAGQSTSLALGVRSVADGADGVMILLGDQPLVTSDAIDRLVDGFRSGTGEIVQAAYDGSPGTPVLFGRRHFGELLEVTGDEGARGIVRRHGDAVRVLEIGDVADLLDVDTDADYDRLLDRWTDWRERSGD